MRHTLRLMLAAALAFLNFVIALPALAQMPEPPPPPVRSMVDERGVDLTSGDVRIVDSSNLSIGTPDNGIAHKRFWSGLNSWRHNYILTVSDSGTHADVVIGQSKVGFAKSGGTFSPDEASGETLTETSTAYTYTAKDGTTIEFTKIASGTSYFGGPGAVGATITSPTGMKTRLHYSTWDYQLEAGGSYVPLRVMRLQSVRTSTGFQIKYTYANNLPPSVVHLSTPSSWDPLVDWTKMTYVAAINAAYDYCDPDADTCGSLTQLWPTVGYTTSTSGSVTHDNVTDPAGRTTSYVIISGRIAGIEPPSTPGTSNRGYVYDSNGKVGVVNVAGVGNYFYTFTSGSGTLTAQVYTPTIPNPRTVVSRTDLVQPTSDTDEDGHTTTYTYCTPTDGYCSPGLLRSVTQHEGNSVAYLYDARGNVGGKIWYPKPGSGLPQLNTSALYPPSCGGSITPAMCNKPTSTTDTAGAITNYYYNSNGTLDYVQLPSPGGGAPRPETHYTYWTGQAWVKWYNTNIGAAPDPIVMLSSTTTCITGTWPCATSAQRKVTLSYPAGPATTNLQVNGVVQSRGDGADYSAMSFTSDAVGNIVSVTDPLGKVSNMAYNGVRQLVWQRSPSVDGSSTGQKRHTTYEFDADGNVNKLGVGTVNWDGSGFSPTQYVFSGYDALGRKHTQWQVNGAINNILAATQWYYNGAGRLECEIVRMNSALFFRGPATDCSGDTPGSYGPDRVTRYQYFSAGQIFNIQTGYGVAAKTLATYVYTPNGKLSTMYDGKANQTTYAYDGHDRLLRECYNTALANCQAGTASDFVQLTYDNVGHLINRSLRGSPSSSIGYVYDALGRVTNANYPGGGLFDAPVTYTYDNLGRLLNATDANNRLNSFLYDTNGNVTAQGGWRSQSTMQYDAAGRRTRMTWGIDGRYVTYEYNATGEMTAIRENGSSLLASFGYDGVGRRTSLTRGNGVTTYYDYDAISRLACLRNDLAGGSTLACSSSSVTASGQDQATNFAYNPASQIVSRTAANDAYAWQGHYNFNYNYATNGLNQYTAVGPFNPTYDVKGNFASTGVGQSFSTSTKNELVYRNDTSVGFYHDPLRQLESVFNGANSYNIEHVDGQISDEFQGASPFAITRRYVYGPNVDEPIVWYEGSDFSDKRYLVADERGSIVAVTNSAGVATNINSYDEYGIPRSSNAGRFQYTGQAWLSELGMYSYKARVYTPTLGRFAQTDPAGYPDGPNWYNYVNADPVNKADPSGLHECVTVITGDESFEECGGVSMPGSHGHFDNPFPYGVPAPDLGAFDPDGLPPQPGVTAGDQPQKPEPSSKFDFWDCAGTVALGGLGGAFSPVGLITEIAPHITGAANRSAPEDDLLSSKSNRPRLQRDLGSAVRVGFKRAVSAAVSSPQARAVGAGIGAGLALLSAESCGIQAIPSMPDVLPSGF